MTAFRHAAVVGVIAVSAVALASCAGGSSSGGSSIDGEVSGTVNFVTWRTDLIQDGTFDAYAKKFTEKYPDASVTFEGITDYEGEMTTRLSTQNYGDVLGIPNSVLPDQFGDYFEPLGKTADFESEYRFLAPKSFDGDQYGLALGGNANGIVYNKAVFEEAGITSIPKTESEWIDALTAIKDNTDATPLYTNYKDGWPLSQWSGNIGAIGGSVDALNDMAKDTSPWTEGNDIFSIDSLIFDSVAAGLTEADPLTTNWEQSKVDLATGKIGAMALGSWAIVQMQAAATDNGADPAAIGYMTFPATAKDGMQYAVVAGDYNLGINVHSQVKAAARAWIDFLITDSGFTATQGMVSPLLSEPLPDNLAGLSDAGVELIELASAPVGEEALFNTIAEQSQVDIWANLYRQKLIDIARGAAPGDKQSYFDELNSRWSAAVGELG